MLESGGFHRFLLRVWRDVPFPGWLRMLFLRIINPSFMVGVSAVVMDSQGRILVLQHTYRREFPWGLPGGWVKRAESLEIGLAREVREETGFEVSVDSLLAAKFFEQSQIDLLYRCTLHSGAYRPTNETSGCLWAEPSALPLLLPNQIDLLRMAGILPTS